MGPVYWTYCLRGDSCMISQILSVQKQWSRSEKAQWPIFFCCKCESSALNGLRNLFFHESWVVCLSPPAVVVIFVMVDSRPTPRLNKFHLFPTSIVWSRDISTVSTLISALVCMSELFSRRFTSTQIYLLSIRPTIALLVLVLGFHRRSEQGKRVFAE